MTKNPGANRVMTIVELLLVGVLAISLAFEPPRRPASRCDVARSEHEGAFERLSADSMLRTVSVLCGQKTRRYTSPGAAATVAYVTSSLRKLGLPVRHQPVKIGDNAGDTVIVTNVLADLSRSGWKGNTLLICAHYGSRGAVDGERAPGADDNASGVAVLLEAARVLVEEGASPPVTLAFFGGEEDSLIGSKGFVSDKLAEHDGLAGVVNVDMVGYDAYGPADFVVFANRRSVALAVEVIEQARCATRLLADTTIVATGNSDHVPFWRAGVPAISIWEGYDHNPHHNTPRDLPGNLTREFLVEMTKLVVATALERDRVRSPTR
jgi:hypothetical protein